MPVLTASEIAALPWSDATFHGCQWLADREAPTLVLHLTSCDQPHHVVSCDWACRLKIELNYDQNVGPLLAVDANFNSLDDNRWSVYVDLSPHGYIDFECNDLRLVPVA